MRTGSGRHGSVAKVDHTWTGGTEVDEGNPVILDALGRIGGIIEEVTATLLDQLDRETAVHSVTRERLGRVVIASERNTMLLATIHSLLTQAEHGGVSDRDTMAKIRGLLHG